MSKRTIVTLTLLVGLLLAACAGQPANTPAETDLPPEPVEVQPGTDTQESESPDAAPVAAKGAPLTADQAMGVTWQWTVLRGADSPMPMVVPNGQNYTLTFLADGTVGIQADCNMVGGTYELGADGDLNIILGPSTMAFCGEESQDTQYLNLLGKVVSGTISADGLTLATSDGETLSFVDAATAVSPVQGLDPAALQNAVWQWTTLAETGQDVASQTAVPDPAAYSVTFQPDGQLAIVADCNVAGGTYELAGNDLSIVPGFSTLAFCGEESLDQRFMALLEAAQTAEIVDGSLNVTTNTGATMTFANGGAPETVSGPTDEDINNILWQWVDYTPSDAEGWQPVPNPEQYSIGFLYDGTAAIQSDCNRIIATYTHSGSSMSIVSGPSTMAACPEGSLEQQFNAWLADVNQVQITDPAIAEGRMTLITNDGVILGFNNAGTLPGTVGLRPSQIGFDTDGLAVAFDTAVIPATPYDNSDPTAPTGLPEHLQITFGAPGTENAPVMFIIPVAAYEALWQANEDNTVSEQIDDIAALTYAMPNPAPTSELPALPPEQLDGSNDVAVQVEHPASEDDSASKNGFRFAGRWSQDATPITNNGMQYVYQGFTNDGQYLVTYFYPELASNQLAATLEETPVEVQDAYAADPLGQLAAVTEQLNAGSVADWTPDLTELDALVAGLRIDGMPANGLVGQTWLWTGRGALGGEITPVTDPTAYAVTFNPDGTLTFQADCNTGGGGFALQGGFNGSIENTLGAMTLVACPPESRADEFLEILSAARTFRVLPGGLSMVLTMPGSADLITFGLEGTVELELTPPEAGTPTGTVTAVDGVFVRSGPGTQFPTLGLAPQGTTGTIAGRSADGQWWAVELPTAPGGLGWVSAAFVMVENVDSVPVVAPPPLPTPTPAPTPMPTPTPLPQPVISFSADQTSITSGQCTTLRWDVANIQAVWVYPEGADYRNFGVTGQGSQQVCPEQTTTYHMRVLLTDGSVVIRSITINVAQVNTLANTSWQLATLNVNQVVIQSQPPLTLSFLGEASVSAFGGCNTLNGSYIATANRISIGPLFGTMLACDENIMGQEQAFQLALESASTYTNDGGTLVLFNAGGSEVARFASITATPFGG